jgi:hypothetical protein
MAGRPVMLQTAVHEIICFSVIRNPPGSAVASVRQVPAGDGG